MNVDSGATAEEKAIEARPAEVDIYMHLLAIVMLLDQKKYETGAKLASESVDKILKLNMRALDLLSSRIIFYYAHLHELIGKLSDIRK